MPPYSDWLNSKIAFTAEELEIGGGCHPNEAQALSDFLNDFISAAEAAKRITTPILNEKDPPEETYRLWGLISEALVELSAKDCLKTIDLLSVIVALPPTPGIDWPRLPGFFSMWHTMWKLHMEGSDGWEKTAASFEVDRAEQLRRHFEAIGRAEAEMYVRGFKTVTNEHKGFQVLALVCSDRAGLDILVGEVVGWLDVAGRKLKEKSMEEETLTESWACWKAATLRLSRDGSRLSEAGRRVAVQCHALMYSHVATV